MGYRSSPPDNSPSCSLPLVPSVRQRTSLLLLACPKHHAAPYSFLTFFFSIMLLLHCSQITPRKSATLQGHPAGLLRIHHPPPSWAFFPPWPVGMPWSILNHHPGLRLIRCAHPAEPPAERAKQWPCSCGTSGKLPEPSLNPHFPPVKGDEPVPNEGSVILKLIHTRGI